MWAYVEADFRRDYGIRLCDELPNMSWREFQVLLQGLSPWGAVATNYESMAEKARLEEESASETPSSAVQSFWAAVTAYKPT